MALLLFMVAIVFVIIRTRNLFAVVMLTGIFSLLSAGLFTVMDAVDVAFTEAAVGAGISTVLMLATLSLTTQEQKAPTSQSPLALLTVLVTGGLLVYGTLHMPAFGDAEAPIHQHPLAEEFIEKSPEKIGIPNMVTSVLASYRGYDTMGETTVVFTAAVGVLLLLSGRPARRSEEDEPTVQTERDESSGDSETVETDASADGEPAEADAAPEEAAT